MYLIYLATEADWCTLYHSDSYPDTAAIQAAYPQIRLWDVAFVEQKTPTTGRSEREANSRRILGRLPEKARLVAE